MKTLLAAFLVAGALLLGATPSQVGATIHHVPAGAVLHHGGAKPLAQTSQAGVLSCGSISCDAYEAGINQFFTDVAADSGGTSNVFGADTQYYDTLSGSQTFIAYDSTFGGSDADTSAYPTSGCNLHDGNVCLTDAQLQTEIVNAIAANGWLSGGTTNLYFILTPNNVDICFDSSGGQCSTTSGIGGFCAYHDNFAAGGTQIAYAVEPFNASLNGCFDPLQGQGAPNGIDIDASVNTISHEWNEAITDPLPETSPGWWSDDSNGDDEIGDLCAWGFGSALGTSGGKPYNQVINNHDYSLQQEYSNTAHGCVQRPGGAASPITDGGVGPMTSHGGAVMRTNTTYAIYWIPSSSSSAAPASTTPPIVSGLAAAGKTLSTTNGTWTGSPTSFAYKWQRCASTGTSCADIPSATGSSYILTGSDAGHAIRSEVSAHNAGGSSSYTPSTPTEVVVPAPAVAVAPAVSGFAVVGKMLSTTQGTWNTPVTYAYQWLRCTSGGASCSAISHATVATYKIVSADRGHTLEARVSATNAAGTTAAVSAPTRAIVAVPAASRLPEISGKAKVGKRLTVSSGAWRDGPTKFAYHWLRCSAGGGSCVRIKGATGSTYRVTRRDAHHRLRVQVTAINAAGRSSSTSPTTGVVKS
jgi:hypothetical protein